MSTQAMDRLLKPSEAAVIIGVSESYIYQLISAGEIEAEQFPYGKRTRPRIRESVALYHKKKREIPEALPLT